MPDPVPRHYLDNAATSFPKPEVVYRAVDLYNREVGVAVGRGAYKLAIELQNVVNRCRKRAADLLNAESPDRVIFTFNGTDSLNLALHGLLRPGDHAVTSVIEHNSVLRPLKNLREHGGVRVTYVSADETGFVDPQRVRDALEPTTRLVTLMHASNVTGTIQPIADVGQIARDAGVFFLVDAAQTVGHLPIDVRDLPIDMLACAGHKGLLGPLGTGLLYLRPGVEEQLQPVKQGGTGSHSEDDHQPSELPDKYESGNHNAPALCGLDAALEFLRDQRIESLRAHEQKLTAELIDRLSGIRGVRVFGPSDLERRVGVVSISLDGYDPQVLAAILDESFGIQTRSGLHCAPGIHKCLGTFASGGTVRFSFGPFNTASHVQLAADALKEIAGSVGGEQQLASRSQLPDNKRHS